MRKVIRWTFFEDEYYPETEWPISDEKKCEYEKAVIQAIRDNGYRITGFAHQGDRFCTPVFDDGKRYSCTFRQWGALMAKAVESDTLYQENIRGYYGQVDTFGGNQIGLTAKLPR